MNNLLNLLCKYLDKDCYYIYVYFFRIFLTWSFLFATDLHFPDCLYPFFYSCIHFIAILLHNIDRDFCPARSCSHSVPKKLTAVYTNNKLVGLLA